MNKLKVFVLILAVVAGISGYAQTSGTLIVNTNIPVNSKNTVSYMVVNPLDVVARPNFYMNKNIKISVIRIQRTGTEECKFAPSY